MLFGIRKDLLTPSKTVSKFIFFNLFASFFNLLASFFNLFAPFFNLSVAFSDLFPRFSNELVALSSPDRSCPGKPYFPPRGSSPEGLYFPI